MKTLLISTIIIVMLLFLFFGAIAFLIWITTYMDKKENREVNEEEAAELIKQRKNAYSTLHLFDDANF